MASKATINRQKSAKKVVAATSTHAKIVETAMTKRYGTEVGRAAGLLMIAMGASLDVQAKIMVEKDNANEAELRDDEGPRKQRDSSSQSLYDALTTTRAQLSTICGPAYVAALGFKGDTPADPVAILRLGEVVLGNLRTQKAPESLIPGYTFDAMIWEAPLADTLGSLKDAISHIATESREAEATLIAKREAITAYDAEFSHTANLAGTLLEIAGEKELAKRVRPSTRRPGQTAEVAPAEGSIPLDQ